jgi:hypothetical protein
VQKALGILLEGYEYARDLGTSPWEFAVDLEALLAAGCSPNTLRWLVRRGVVEHAILDGSASAATRRGQVRRQEMFPRGTCFTLTKLGATVAQGGSLPAGACFAGREAGSAGLAAATTPVWDSCRGELRFLGRLVKRFRNAASNQRALLDAFQQRGWPERLTDPLPRPLAGTVNLKQRLHDTIKNLNRGHEERSLHFYGAEAGRAVGWKLLS